MAVLICVFLRDVSLKTGWPERGLERRHLRGGALGASVWPMGLQPNLILSQSGPVQALCPPPQTWVGTVGLANLLRGASACGWRCVCVPPGCACHTASKRRCDRKCSKHLTMRGAVHTCGRRGCFPSACVRAGNHAFPPRCFSTQSRNCHCSQQKTFGDCATGGRYLTNLRCGPRSRRKPSAGQCGRSA